MKFKLIEKAPDGAEEYTQTTPYEDEEKFVSNLRGLLDKHPMPIVAKDIPIGWAGKVEDFALEKGFDILMLRSVVNPLAPELGTAFGTFYYKKKKPN